MPLGILTSQFFANVYLNELDQFVKHQLNATYYLRYVDDFVILHPVKSELEVLQQQIHDFLSRLQISLHPKKSHIIPLTRGVNFLGFRIFYHHKLLRKSNLRRFKQKPLQLKKLFETNYLTYDDVYNRMLGSCAHARHAHAHSLTCELAHQYDAFFPKHLPAFEIDRWVKMNSPKHL